MWQTRREQQPDSLTPGLIGTTPQQMNNLVHMNVHVNSIPSHRGKHECLLVDLGVPMLVMSISSLSCLEPELALLLLELSGSVHPLHPRGTHLWIQAAFWANTQIPTGSYVN